MPFVRTPGDNLSRRGSIHPPNVDPMTSWKKIALRLLAAADRRRWLGTGPFFGGKTCLARKAPAENMDLSPFRDVTSALPRKLGQSPVNGYPAPFAAHRKAYNNGFPL